MYPKVDRDDVARTAKEKGCAILGIDSDITKLGKPEFKFIIGAASSLFVTSGITLAFPFVLGKVLDLALVQETADAVGVDPLYLSGGMLGLFSLKALQW